MLLRTDGLTVRYGGVCAVRDLDVTVGAGELVGLIGPNGAGKTSCIDAVSGFAPYEGSVLLDDRPIDDVPAHRRARRGLVRTFQQVELFDDLDVRGNLRVAAGRRSLDDAVGLLGIADLLDRRTDELSEGQRKLVGLARALVHEPRVLLLDEPASGLDTTESEALGDRLRGIVERGVAILLVDHDVPLVLGVCDRIVVIEQGAAIASGTPDEIRRDPRVVAAYLGATA